MVLSPRTQRRISIALVVIVTLGIIGLAIGQAPVAAPVNGGSLPFLLA